VAEWGYILGGSGRIAAIDKNGRNYVADVSGPKPGQDPDLYVFPVGVPHSIQALDEGLEILVLFADGDFEKTGTTFHLSDWLVHTPLEVLAQNFGVNASVFEKLPTKNPYIFNSTKPPPQLGHASDPDQRPESPDGLIPTPYVFRLKDQKPQNALGGGGYVKIQTSDTNFPVRLAFLSREVSCSNPFDSCLSRAKNSRLLWSAWNPEDYASFTGITMTSGFTSSTGLLVRPCTLAARMPVRSTFRPVTRPSFPLAGVTM
jgi:oxalate decarboxylase family bicupin protein